jgi:Fusaric acid resistance protein family
MFILAGFPLSAWAFALRAWGAIMVTLYAAFWLQLESASTAVVTLGILALQMRGQAYEKAPSSGSSREKLKKSASRERSNPASLVNARFCGALRPDRCRVGDGSVFAVRA